MYLRITYIPPGTAETRESVQQIALNNGINEATIAIVNRRVTQGCRIIGIVETDSHGTPVADKMPSERPPRVT